MDLKHSHKELEAKCQASDTRENEAARNRAQEADAQYSNLQVALVSLL